MSEVKEVLTGIDEALKEDSSYGEDINATYQLDIKDEEPRKHKRDNRHKQKTTGEGVTEAADCTLELASDDIVELANGNLNGTQAFMSGTLYITHNMCLPLKFHRILISFTKN